MNQHKPHCQLSALGWAVSVPPVCTCPIDKEVNKCCVECTCGSWPDPYWTKESYRRKAEAQKNCPRHKPQKERSMCCGEKMVDLCCAKCRMPFVAQEEERCICDSFNKPIYHVSDDPHDLKSTWYCQVHGKQSKYFLIHTEKKDYCKPCQDAPHIPEEKCILRGMAKSILVTIVIKEEKKEEWSPEVEATMKIVSIMGKLEREHGQLSDATDEIEAIISKICKEAGEEEREKIRQELLALFQKEDGTDGRFYRMIEDYFLTKQKDEDNE